MDDLRAVYGLTSQVGRSDGMRPASRIGTDLDGGGGAEYQPNDWRDDDQPATTRVRRRPRHAGSISSDDIPSPLQQELDRMRTVGEANAVDTKTLRGKKYYSGESSSVIATNSDGSVVMPNQVVEGDDLLPQDPLDPDLE